ncbi:helix-turn-helix domain-containing protein [Bradyrhizobium sp. USDA 4508]
MPANYRRARPEITIALSPRSVADAIGLSRDVVEQAIKSAELPVFSVGTKHRILVSDVESFIRRQKLVQPRSRKQRGATDVP